MKLKEIKPGMAIHCKNDEEKKALLEEAERLRYVWIDKSRPTDFQVFESTGMTINFYKSGYITWSDDTEGVTEFSDLILHEMTAEEAIKIFGEICKGSCQACPLYAVEPYEACENLCYENPEKIVEILAQWKSDHEKKEPEIETVDICRIIEIQPNGKKRCVHEEDMNNPDRTIGEKSYSLDVEKILRRYCMEHDGEFIAVHEVVSRVKK